MTRHLDLKNTTQPFGRTTALWRPTKDRRKITKKIAEIFEFRPGENWFVLVLLLVWSSERLNFLQLKFFSLSETNRAFMLQLPSLDGCCKIWQPIWARVSLEAPDCAKFGKCHQLLIDPNFYGCENHYCLSPGTVLAKYFSFEGLSLVHLINDNKANGACPDPFRTWHLRNNLNEFLKSI